MNTKKALHKKLKTLWSIAVVYKWGDMCECCGVLADVPHHYIPKSKSLMLKYDVLNGVPICSKHHFLIHNSHNPEVTRKLCEIIRKKRGQVWCDYIETKSKQRAKDSLWWLQEMEETLCKKS